MIAKIVDGYAHAAQPYVKIDHERLPDIVVRRIHAQNGIAEIEGRRRGQDTTVTRGFDERGRRVSRWGRNIQVTVRQTGGLEALGLQAFDDGLFLALRCRG